MSNLPEDLHDIQSKDELSSAASACNPHECDLDSEYDEFSFSACAHIIHALIPAPSEGVKRQRKIPRIGPGPRSHWQRQREPSVKASSPLQVR